MVPQSSEDCCEDAVLWFYAGLKKHLAPGRWIVLFPSLLRMPNVHSGVPAGNSCPPSHTCSQLLFVPNERPRLCSYSNAQTPASNQAEDAQAELIINNNGITNMYVVNSSPESHSSPRRIQMGYPEYIMSNQELCAADAVFWEYIRSEKSAGEFQFTVSRQCDVNVDYEKTIIAQKREISDTARSRISHYQRRLADEKVIIEGRTALQRSLEHDLDYLVKEDETHSWYNHVESLENVVGAHNSTIPDISLRLRDIERSPLIERDKLVCSQKDETTAVDRLNRTIKITGALVARYERVVAQKSRWYVELASLHKKPESSLTGSWTVPDEKPFVPKWMMSLPPKEPRPAWAMRHTVHRKITRRKMSLELE
jgi:hypothetical protein